MLLIHEQKGKGKKEKKETEKEVITTQDIHIWSPIQVLKVTKREKIIDTGGKIKNEKKNERYENKNYICFGDWTRSGTFFTEKY